MTVHEYPAHEHNPVPWNGDEDAWRAWTERSVVLEECGARCTEARPGRLVVEVDHSPVMLNPIGSFHGGMVAAVADAVAGSVFVRSVEPGHLPATATLNVEYHRPAFPPLTFTGTVTNQGRTLLFVEVDVRNRDGRTCSRAHVVLAVKGKPL